MINYGIVYGLSDFGLADRLNIPREEAKEFIDAYLERFPRVAAFMAETIERAKEQSYVTTLWGRRRQIPELQARNYQVRMLGERLAVNTVIQGTAADIIKLAMVRTHAALAESRLQTRLLLTIHDELLFEGPPRAGRRTRADRARDVRRREHDPPLAVDVGVGQTGWRRSEPRGGVRRRRRRLSVDAGADQLAPGRSVGSRGATVSFLVDRRARADPADRRGGSGLGQSAAPWWALVGGCSAPST